MQTIEPEVAAPPSRGLRWVRLLTVAVHLLVLAFVVSRLVGIHHYGAGV